jgi:[NiFe] hydrogenase diaphorase moiety small subunit
VSERPTFLLDGEDVPFTPGQTVLQAALTAGRYIPHLCYHPEFKPHGSCKVCTAKVNGRTVASCTTPAESAIEVESNTEELNDLRRTLVQMLFAEGNHFCPSCEKSGDCILQASRDVDGKCVFTFSGRGLDKHLIVNSESGLLRDTDVALTDVAVQVCPVGVIQRKRVGFAVPIGQRRFDQRPISEQALDDAPRQPGGNGHA